MVYPRHAVTFGWVLLYAGGIPPTPLVVYFPKDHLQFHSHMYMEQWIVALQSALYPAQDMERTAAGRHPLTFNELP